MKYGQASSTDQVAMGIMIRELLKGPKSVDELIQLTGFAQSTVHKHLNYWKSIGIIRWVGFKPTSRTDGRGRHSNLWMFGVKYGNS
jgi:predicted transcriptional regulator